MTIGALNAVIPPAEASSLNHLNNAESYKDKKIPIFSIASKLPLLPQGVVDVAAGYGDGVSFGLTQWLREKTGIDNVVDKNSNTYNASLLAGIATPYTAYGKTISFALAGREIELGSKYFRLALFGNRTGHPTGKYPHYHRRVQENGKTLPGQSDKRHRPWDHKETDKSFWDRF